MTVRIPLARHTKASLDALYDENDRLRHAADPELRRQLAAVIEALGRSETELAALRQVARGYCPACGRGDAAPTVADWEQQRQRADQAEELSHRLLDQRQEMAEERYIWQQRGDRAEALLRQFTAEAHRRKWNYDRGLDGNGAPIQSKAFNALHQLGDEMLAELDKLRAERPAATEATDGWTPPPPGDRREQLPDHLLALIDTPSYLSTACEAASLLARQMPAHTLRRVELGDHADRLHTRCRLQNKFTGVACRCHCHGTPASAATEATGRETTTDRVDGVAS
jgi:hypothetical protein